jgi:hypothetical protein
VANFENKHTCGRIGASEGEKHTKTSKEPMRHAGTAGREGSRFVSGSPLGTIISTATPPSGNLVLTRLSI